MKHSSLLLLAVSAGVIGLVASSQGVAEAQNRDRTGAPGSDPVCTSCHNGSTSANASFEVIDAATQGTVTEYVPGQEYLVRMVIAGGDASSLYGMQSTAVLADGSNAGAFSAPSSNAQLQDVDGRHIVEHNASSSANVFEVSWTAPEAGSGNGSTNGDGYLAATLSVPEMTNTDGLADVNVDAWARPMPLGDTWTWTTPEAGRLVVADLAGRVVLARDAAAGQPLTWNASGTTVVNFVSERGQRQSWKLALR